MNPKITVEPVTRRFFNLYCYKLDLTIHGSAFLRYPDTPIADQIDNRKKVNRRINFAGTWRNYINQTPDHEDILALTYLLNYYIKNQTDLKFRIEEPTVSVYAQCEEDLYKLASLLCRSVKSTKHVKCIYRPRTQEHLDLLEQGYTIKQNKFGYKYKIMLREGRYNFAVKQQLHNYLKNLGNDVLLPKHLEEALDKPYDSFWGSYFYSKDTDILTMLALIHPNFVRSVETYHTVNK